jgi:uncharacterized protein with HEPN domain
MPPDVFKLLVDMRSAAAGISQFVAGRTFADFKSDLMVKLAVEREFEIIGEALGRLLKADAATAEKITEYRRIIGFRNVLIHGYDTVSDDVTWKIIEEKLPILVRELDAIIAKPAP